MSCHLKESSLDKCNLPVVQKDKSWTHVRLCNSSVGNTWNPVFYHELKVFFLGIHVLDPDFSYASGSLNSS